MDKKRKEQLIRNQIKIIKEHKKILKLWKGLLNKTSFEKLVKNGDNNCLDKITSLVEQERRKIREDIMQSIKYSNEIKFT